MIEGKLPYQYLTALQREHFLGAGVAQTAQRGSAAAARAPGIGSNFVENVGYNNKFSLLIVSQ